MTPQVWAIKINKLDIIKINNFCSAEDTVKMLKTLGENICRPHISSKAVKKKKIQLGNEQKNRDTLSKKI